MRAFDDSFAAASVGASAGFSAFSNDVGIGPMTVIGAGGRSAPGPDNGFWRPGSQGGCFWIGASGEIWFFPDDDFEQLAPGVTVETTVAYLATDAAGATASASITAMVAVAEGSPPLAADDAFDASSASSAAAQLLANDAGVGLRIARLGDEATPTAEGVFAARGDAGGSFSVTPQGAATFQPDDDFDALAPGETAVTSVRYLAVDAQGRAAEATAAVTVVGAAPPPVAVNDRASALIGASAEEPISLLANDAGAGLRVVAAGGRSVLNADGGFWVDGDAGGGFWIDPTGDAFFFDRGDFDDLAAKESAVTTVRYTVADAAGRTAEGTLSVQVSAEARSPYEFGDSRRLEHPEKIGLGVWDEPIPGYDTPLEYLNTLKAGWYYTWSLDPLPGATHMEFVPMVWDEKPQYYGVALQEAADRYGVILGYNEPDIQSQANMSVALGLELWPQLEATGARLGSPSAAGSPLKNTPRKWSDDFLFVAEEEDLRIDFLGLHTYTHFQNVDRLKDYLISVYEKYKKPIWITEFGLVNWLDRDRFSQDEIAEFLTESFLMLDDLTFVERHAWFSPQLHPGDINTYFLDEDGLETPIAAAYHELFA